MVEAKGSKDNSGTAGTAESAESNEAGEAGTAESGGESGTVSEDGETVTISGGSTLGPTTNVAFLKLFVDPPTVDTTPYYDAATREINNLTLKTKFIPIRVEMTDPDSMMPDEPPQSVPMPDNTHYALTGEVYYDDEFEEYHYQLWLWNMVEPALVYTDELVAADFDESDMYIPAMVEWIFSHVFSVSDEYELGLRKEEPEDDTSPDSEEWKHKWLYLGIKGGLTSRFYLSALPADITEADKSSLGFEAGLQAAVQFLPNFAVQVEALFTMDKAKFNYIEHQPDTNEADGALLRVDHDWEYSSYSLNIPVLIKLPFRPHRFLVAPYAGIYVTLPIGQMTHYNGKTGAEESFDWKNTLPIGYIAGFDLGIKLGPGVLFTDIRYAADIGRAARDSGDLYTRHGLSFSLGYEIGLISKKRRAASAAPAKPEPAPEETPAAAAAEEPAEASADEETEDPDFAPAE
jgi:hypothetical protein